MQQSVACTSLFKLKRYLSLSCTVGPFLSEVSLSLCVLASKLMVLRTVRAMLNKAVRLE